jgi:hypothetical protein
VAIDGLRALVLETNFEVYGVPATITRPFPDDTPIESAVIWLTPGLTRPFTDPLPLDQRLQRRDVERIVAIRVADVPTVPKGTRIDAAEPIGGVSRAWRVDSVEHVDSEQFRVHVVEETEPES